MSIGSDTRAFLGDAPFGGTREVAAPGAGREAPLPSATAQGDRNARMRDKRRGGAGRGGADGPGSGSGGDSGQAPKAISQLQALDNASLRRKTLLVGGALIVALCFALCIDEYSGTIVSPLELISIYGMFFNQLIAQFMHSPDIMSSAQLLDWNPHYYSLTSHAGSMFVTVVGGMLLALAGTLYQSVFRNPIASPTMLGISSGTQIGQLVLVLLFGANAVNMAGWRYALSYGAVIVTLIALVGISKLISGPGRPLNVINMLLVGTILSQLAGVITTYVTWYVFDDEMWEIYHTLSEVVVIDTYWFTYVFITVMAIVSVTPIVLMRFRLNVLSFDETEMRMLGVDANRLQVVALVCATLMMVAAQISVGTVAMLSLVVPHVSRFLFGAEFRKQFVGNVLLGALLLVVCRCIVPFIPFVGSFLPLGTVVSIVVLPAFVWMIAVQQRTWE